MKYYLIAGEASGDLHASHLMHEIRRADATAEFRFIGGDLMAAEGGAMVKHYRHLAYMGFVPVLMHLPTIMRNMRQCKEDISQWHPDVVILVDYPGFNLSIARYVKSNAICPVYYYISPKIWAWKEYRIKNIKRDVDKLFSILPFEVDFFEKKHHYPIHYVGNPTAQEVKEWRAANIERTDEKGENQSDGKKKPIIALLAGSRRQEIKDNLPAMIEATRNLSSDYDVVLAGAPSIAPEYYQQFIASSHVSVVFNQTFDLLSRSTAALVTSGTATLETALFGIPQVVCYKTPLPRLINFLRRKILKVEYISLVNLIAGREVVTELVANTFTIDNIKHELHDILPDGKRRNKMIDDYKEVWQRLGDGNAPRDAADIITTTLHREP